MTAPAGHPDPIYAGFARPFERNPTTRVPNQPHRGGKLSPYLLFTSQNITISFNNRNTSHCTHYLPFIFTQPSLSGSPTGARWSTDLDTDPWAYRIRITLQTSTEWRPLVPIFTRILFPSYLVSPCKIHVNASLLHWLKDLPLHTAFAFWWKILSSFHCPLSKFMHANKTNLETHIGISQFLIFTWIKNIICACRAFIKLHLHLILPIGFAILHAGWRNKCKLRANKLFTHNKYLFRDM